MKKKIEELVVGDLVDLQGDSFADKGNHPEFEFEYSEVGEIERETDACTCIYFNNFVCGFPPDHMVEVVERAEPG